MGDKIDVGCDNTMVESVKRGNSGKIRVEEKNGSDDKTVCMGTVPRLIGYTCEEIN